MSNREAYRLSEIVNTYEDPTKDLDLAEELFNSEGVAQQIENFEAHLGISPPKKERKFKFDCAQFSLEVDSDRRTMLELLNNTDDFEIVSWDKTWTHTGNARILVFYKIFEEPKRKDEQGSTAETD